MSYFEIVMIICFGAAWPFSIYTSVKSRSTAGKSVIFLFVVFAGYVAGVFHKYFHNNDPVIYLYIINLVMVLIDIVVYFVNMKREKGI